MQISRLFNIIYILLEKDRVTASELSSKLEVSQRTIYRDVDKLSEVGVPIYMSKGKGGGISLLPDYILDKTFLTDEDKEDIMASMKAMAILDPTDNSDSLNKLNSFLGDNNSDWIEIDFSTWSDPRNEKSIFEKLKESILKKEKVNFDYVNNKGESSKRTVRPLKLGFRGQSWYLFAYCQLKEQHRFFKLSRIKNLGCIGEIFDDQTPSKIFVQEEPFKEEMVEVTLKFEPCVAHRVYDEFDSYEKDDEGNFIVTIDYPKGKWLFSYIISFGEHCKIISPENVKKEYKNILLNLLKKY